MQRDAEIRLGKAGEQAILDHATRATDRLLGWLANKHQRTVPGIFATRHDGGRSHDRCHVEIVAAGVHHGNVETCVIFRTHLAGVSKAGLLLDGKGVEFGAQHYSWSGAVLQDGDDSSVAYVL